MEKNQIKYQELLDIVKSMESDEELLLFFLRACENKNFKICQLCLDAGIWAHQPVSLQISWNGS